MANTTALSKDERKKSKRAARKKLKTENPLKPRDYARGSKKPKVKKLARGQAKRVCSENSTLYKPVSRGEFRSLQELAEPHDRDLRCQSRRNISRWSIKNVMAPIGRTCSRCARKWCVARARAPLQIHRHRSSKPRRHKCAP